MRSSPIVLSLLALGLALPSASAQAVSPGFRFGGTNGGTTVDMLDNTGAVVHTWSTAFNPGLGVEMLEDGSLLRAIRTTTVPGIGGGVGGGIQRLALDGTVLWDYRYETGGNVSHHDIEPLPNGNVLLIAWETKTVAQATAAGRDPALISGTVMRPDHIIEVQPTGPTSGTIVWEWHVWDHLIQDFDGAQANFGVVADHPELVDVNYPPLANEANDWNHMNSVDYDPVHDLVLLSANRQDEIWVIDHSTTTTEAAGHTGGARGKGGDLLYRWGNPAAYGAGTTGDQQLFGQHSPVFVPAGYPGAGNMLVFNNNPPGGSAVFELVPPQDVNGDFSLVPGLAYGPAAPVWTHSGGFNSTIMSSALRLENGNTLICSGSQALFLEVTPAGTEVFHEDLGSNVFHARYTERTLWADGDSVSVANGGSVGFDVIAGTIEAGQDYLMLGSISGTAPGFNLPFGNVPLNWDEYSELTFSLANSAALTNTYGTLDGLGRAAMSLNVPPGALPASAIGAVLYHAVIAFNPGTFDATWASSPVGVMIDP